MINKEKQRGSQGAEGSASYIAEWEECASTRRSDSPGNGLSRQSA